MLRRDRNRAPDAAPEPERFDLPAINAARARDQAAATAAEMAKVPPAVHAIAASAGRPQPDPLARLLERPPLVGLPPLELVAEHDDGLAGLLRRAVDADRTARRLATEYSDHVPGGVSFKADLDGATTVAAIEWLLTVGPAKRFANAVMARRVAEKADDELRTAAAKADRLRAQLTERAAELADEIRAQCEHVASTKRRRDLEDADEVAGRWRELLSLRTWTSSPRHPWRPLDGRTIPKAATVAWVDAMVALGDPISVLSEGHMINGVPVDDHLPIGVRS